MFCIVHAFNKNFNIYLVYLFKSKKFIFCDKNLEKDAKYGKYKYWNKYIK